MKANLLKIVQDILSAMDSDEVNSIGDTVESRQVASVVESAYNNILARTEFQEQLELFELKASGDPSKPNLLYVPISVDTVEWLRYNSTSSTGYEELKFVPSTEFIEEMYSLGSTYRNDSRLSQYSTMSGDSSLEIFYLNDRDPTKWTIINNLGVVLDSVNLSVEDTAQKNRTLAYGRKNYNFELSDTFTPALDSIHFNLLLQEAKALAFAELKQTSHSIAEKNVKESRIHAQRRKDQDVRASFYRRLPNYGRI